MVSKKAILSELPFSFPVPIGLKVGIPRTAVRGYVQDQPSRIAVENFPNPIQRKLVDCSSPASRRLQRGKRRCSKFLESTQSVRMLVESRAGLEQSTNFRWVGFGYFKTRSFIRLDLNNPRTAVRGIPSFCANHARFNRKHRLKSVPQNCY